MRVLLAGLIVSALLLCGCAGSVGAQKAAGSGDTIADQVATALHATKSEPMGSVNPDDANTVLGRLSSIVASNPEFSYASTDPKVEPSAQQITAGMTFSDRSTLYLVSVSPGGQGSEAKFERYLIVR